MTGRTLTIPSKLKRRGRPMKAPSTTDPTKVTLAFRVTPATKRFIDQGALARGSTQSVHVEFLIERCQLYERVMEALHTTLETIERDGVEAALYRKGWRPIRFPKTDKKLWAEPGYPGIEPGGVCAEDDR
jgi:hypothetical protein